MTGTDTATDARKTPWFPIDNIVVDAFNLTPNEGWLYTVIVKFANRKTGEAFPSHAKLAKVANMSKSSVIRCIAALEKKNLIKVERDVVKGKKQKAVNHYVVLDPYQVAEGSVTQTPRSFPKTLPVVSEVDSNNNQLINTKEQQQPPVESDRSTPSKPVVVVGSEDSQDWLSKPASRNGNHPAPLTDPAFGELVRAYESDIGAITPITGELLKADFEAYPREWIYEAIRIAVLQNNRRWAYVRGILKRWAVDGIGAPRPGAKPGEKPTPIHLPRPMPVCKVCGGEDGLHPTGVLLGENNASTPCPACLEAERASEVSREHAA